MKRREVIFVTLLFAVFMASNSQVSAKEKRTESGEKAENIDGSKIEIIAVHLPDSIVFKPAAGVEIKPGNIQVSIVSGDVSCNPKEFSGSGGLKQISFNNYVFTEKTIITVREFTCENSFKPQKIIFTVDEQKIIYDIATSEFMASNSQVSAQEKETESGEKAENNDGRKIEIIAVHLPDSIVFKPATGVEIASDNINVNIVSGDVSCNPRKLSANGGLKQINSNIYAFTEKTIMTVKEFICDSSFKPQKIIFTVDEQNIIFDIATSEWE